MISANILELLGAFFLGAVVASAILWTATIPVERKGDDDDDGDGGPPQKRAPA